jgi:hypothetical protein
MTSICLVVIMDVYFWRLNKAVKEDQGVNEGLPGWLYTL